MQLAGYKSRQKQQCKTVIHRRNGFKSEDTMNIRIICLLLFSLRFAVTLGDYADSCPDFTATFVVVMEQNISSVRLINDREQTFFK